MLVLMKPVIVREQIRCASEVIRKLQKCRGEKAQGGLLQVKNRNT